MYNITQLRFYYITLFGGFILMFQSCFQTCVTGMAVAWLSLESFILAFYSHVLTEIPAQIDDYIHHNAWYEITYPFPNFNGTTFKVWESISDFIPHFTGHVITYPILKPWRIWIKSIGTKPLSYKIKRRPCTYFLRCIFVRSQKRWIITSKQKSSDGKDSQLMDS